MIDEMLSAEDHESAEREKLLAIAKLDSLGQALAEKRKEAVEFRERSGIEQIWEEDQEYYNGGPDSPQTVMEKPATSAGRVTAKKTDDSPLFVNITQPYCDMASARVSDMLSGDQPFGLLPTPMPDLEAYANSEGVQTLEDGTQIPSRELYQQIQTKAAEIASRSELRIWDWLVESQWDAEIRKVIEDAARIGTGVMKGPVPYRRKVKKVVKTEGVNRIEVDYDTQPQSKRIDANNLFPDPACGEDIHRGSFLWERDYLTRKQLADLKGGEYLDDQIDLCIKEGPGGSTDPKDRGDEKKKSVFEVWYYHGEATADDLLAAGCECEEGECTARVIVTMVNDRVIKAAISPLDSGEFPYDILPWQRRGGSWAGTGIARQVRAPQRMLNSATMTMLNNAGLSARGILFLRRSGITPADGVWTLTPGKIFWVDDTADSRRVEDALKIIEIPSRQTEMAAIIQYALDMAERLTNMPLMMQGQQGGATDTVGGMQILQSNAGAVLRRVAKLFDDNIIEPHVRRYYEWLLLYGDDPDEKGDAQIDARGSSVMFERDAQHQSIIQMAAAVKDPAFGIDPNKWIIEAFKAQGLDPARFQYTKEELAKKAQEQAQAVPSVDPRTAGQLEVAKIRTGGEMERAKLTQQSDMAELELRASEAQKQRNHDKEMKGLDYQIKLMEYAEKRGLGLDEAKAKLTDTAMKLRTQVQLSDKVVKQVTTPPTEPAGLADDGKAYQE